MESKRKYKEQADRLRRLQTFEFGELLMFHLHNRQLAGSYSKLKARKFGPCEVLNKMSDIAYHVNFPTELNTSPTFSVSDLMKYHPPEAADNQLRTIAFGEKLFRTIALGDRPNIGLRRLDLVCSICEHPLDSHHGRSSPSHDVSIIRVIRRRWHL